MHWFESAVYFSAAPIFALVAPLYMYRVLSMGLLILPLEDHCGFGSWTSECTVNHYIHHSKFNWNYGNSPTWDYLMGTNYPKQGAANQKLDTKRERQAAKQAELVRCNIGKDLKDVANVKKD